MLSKLSTFAIFLNFVRIASESKPTQGATVGNQLSLSLCSMIVAAEE